MMRLRVIFIMISLLSTRALAEGATFCRMLERVASMDPAQASSVYSSQAVQMCYETLLEFDYHNRPYRLIPALAQSLPEINSNATVYVFRINPNACFHADPCFGIDASGALKGRPVVAEDLVYSLKRLADRKVSSPGSWLVDDTIKGMRAFVDASMGSAPTDYSMEIAGLKALDAHTLQIELTQPKQQFVWYFAMGYTAAVPHEAVDYYGAGFGNHAVGTGAYQLESWRRNHQMSFARKESWHGWRTGPAAFDPAGEMVPFDRVVYRVIEDVSTQWLCFLSGELDFLGSITRDNWDVVVNADGELDESLRDRGIKISSILAMEVYYIGLNMDDPVLGNNRKLRQALNCAFDSARWVRFFNNRALPCDGPVPPGIAGRLETPFAYEFNLEKARQLLSEAGYPDGIDPQTGKRLVLTLDLGRTSQEIRESTELLVSFYDKIGISLQPHFQNWPVFLQRISNRQSQMFNIGWIADYPDAENFMQMFYGKNVSPGPNRTNYINPELDQLYEKAGSTTDEAQRNRIWEAAQEIVREDCPWIFVYYRKTYTLNNDRLFNYQPTDFPYGAEKYYRRRN
ncbi:MAG: ABC transporter substrate-binding protein [Kiritimatiellae bacterium]|nr:ABC transporter substrate-binding protein [Kiritimatiellia bacterium]